MPLLKKKSFEKVSTALLRDDEEVFYCEITGEVFRNYEEFSERLFLCNSMVWICSMTGKSNLTYLEALESEENARKSLQEFPHELKMPILFLASKTKRTSFGEMAEDVFIYAKDRYFIGENLETCFMVNKWKKSHVLQVIAPQDVKVSPPQKNGTTHDRHFLPPASAYKYEIEHLDAEDEDVSEIMIVDHSQIRRRKTVFNRDKSKLFLKQYVEQDEAGVWIIKQSAIETFGINKMKFEQIFDGPPPNFETSKKIGKLKQETLAKYLTKNGLAGDAPKKVKKDGVNLLEAMKKREEDFKLRKQQKEEEKLALKQKKKEEALKIAGLMREFTKPKDDLELEDHAVLPEPTPIVSAKIPDEHMGDFLMILEFVENFSKVLSTNDFFPQGFTYELLERALVDMEVAGPLTDVIQMFLNALFGQQEEESNQYRTQVEKSAEITEKDLSDNLTLHVGTRLATQASGWSQLYQGVPLANLPLYPLTVSEILRLHLLSSGARINDTGARWRFQERGGYTSEDDPGLYLRLHEPHILKALAVHNVVQLPLSDKIKIISCLMNQLLTYADVRDLVEERLDKARQMKQELRMAQVAERKRDMEYISERTKIKKECKDDAKAMEDELNKLEKRNEKRLVENERKIEKSMNACTEKQTFLGCDRAFRKYFKLESLPGMFVNFEEDNPGVCLDSPVKHCPNLVDADKDEILKHLQKTREELNSSDKENEGVVKMNGHVDSAQPVNCDYNRLLLCSANSKCIVHAPDVERIRWSFYHHKEDLDYLINKLNKRGFRESDLRQVLKMDKERLQKYISHTPVTQLNANAEVDESIIRPKSLRKTGKDRYEDANLGFPPEMSPEDVLHNAIIDNILEMEDKLFSGGLGSLLVKNRNEWRDCLCNKNYDDLDRTIVKLRDLGMAYQEPGRFLGADDDTNEEQPPHLSKAIKTLSIALAQVAQSVKPTYLKRPLGKCDSKPSDKKKENVLDQWMQSLLASTSFSQVFLHYGTLDSCVMWSRSALLARCRICRRQKDSENMLLCDNCNLGHHLYCLKPKLSAIPQGDWFCMRCSEEREKLLNPEPVAPLRKRRIFKEEVDEEESDDADEEEEDQKQSDEDSEEVAENGAMKVDVCKHCGSGGELVNCDECSANYHRECVDPPLRRLPRGAWTCTSCKENKEKKDKEDKTTDSDSDDEEEEVVNSNRRCHRREDNREDLPLHNVVLQELLRDVMRHKDAWPFLRPVQKTEVPDYYDVITSPMDFGTIKYKLNMGEYNADQQLMKDAVLVFANCNAYNHSDADVYKCGVQVQEFFQKRCKELGLKLPEELMMDTESENESSEPDTKKRRIK